MLMDLFHRVLGLDHHSVIMIKDLQTRGLLHKYMDDSSVTEEVSDLADSHLQEDTDNIVQWSVDNHTKINGKKTKEMVISFKTYPHSFQP